MKGAVSVSSATFCIDAPAWCSKMRDAFSRPISCLATLISGAIDWLKLHGLTLCAVFCPVIGWIGGLFVCFKGFQTFTGFCRSSFLSSASWKVDESDWGILFCTIRLGLPVNALSSGPNRCDLSLWLPWLLEMFTVRWKINHGDSRMFRHVICGGSPSLNWLKLSVEIQGERPVKINDLEECL